MFSSAGPGPGRAPDEHVATGGCRSRRAVRRARRSCFRTFAQSRLLVIDPSSSGLPRPPAWLLAPDNEVLVKGAVWATGEIGEPWVVPLLGRLALRGAAPSPHATVTTALSLPVTRVPPSRPSRRSAGRPESHPGSPQRCSRSIRRRDLLKASLRCR